MTAYDIDRNPTNLEADMVNAGDYAEMMWTLVDVIDGKVAQTGPFTLTPETVNNALGCPTPIASSSGSVTTPTAP